MFYSKYKSFRILLLSFATISLLTGCLGSTVDKPESVNTRILKNIKSTDPSSFNPFSDDSEDSVADIMRTKYRQWFGLDN